MATPRRTDVGAGGEQLVHTPLAATKRKEGVMFGQLTKPLEEIVELLKKVVERLDRLDDIERQLRELKKLLEEQKKRKQS